MKLYIKNMVSLRCKILVKEELKKLKLQFLYVDFGTIELLEVITQNQRNELKQNLLICGLELLDEKNHILIEKIKNVIIELIHYSEEQPLINYSEYIRKKIGYDYTYLSNTFSQSVGITIQNFIINQKIEKTKEWLLFSELTLTEIAYKLNYSSVAHLSYQFKKVTSLTPSNYIKKHQKKDNFSFNL